MNRRDLMRIKAYAEAMAKAAALLLKDEARHEFDANQTAITATVKGEMTGSTSVSNPSLQVEDLQAFLAWLRKNHAAGQTEVIEVLTVRNQEWLTRWLQSRAHGIMLGQEDAPPGTKLDEGGRFVTFSVTVDPGVKRHLEQIALRSLGEGFTYDTEGLWYAALAQREGSTDDGRR